MQPQELFRNLSPLDHRYRLANGPLFEKLQEYLSEEASIKYCLEVELALLKAHISHRFDSNQAEELRGRIDRIRIEPSLVYEEDQKTRHSIRALVNLLQQLVPPELAHLVHLGATSSDILGTANSLRIKALTRDVILPLLASIICELCNIAEAEAETAQIGRTHGQHAVPISFGFALSEYISRLGKAMLNLDKKSSELCGKLSGACGAYNAMSILYDDPVQFESEFLFSLGLEKGDHSTQIVEPEYVLRLLLEVNTAFGIIANLADDLRNLQRSEIAEVCEDFSPTQVGSSTMPQKRNPWNAEHIKSLWKTFAPRVMTFFMDQISEHQRDLTNSASERFISEYLAGFSAACNRLLTVIKGIGIDRKKMLSNIYMNGDSILAEPLYIMLADANIPDAHEIIRRANMEKGEASLHEAIMKDEKIAAIIRKKLAEKGWQEPDEFFSKAESYKGLAPEIARTIVVKYRTLASAFLPENDKRRTV